MHLCSETNEGKAGALELKLGTSRAVGGRQPFKLHDDDEFKFEFDQSPSRSQIAGGHADQSASSVDDNHDDVEEGGTAAQESVVVEELS